MVGEKGYTQRDIVLRIVREYVKQFPNSTFQELRATFKRVDLGRFAQNEFLQDDIESAKNWHELGEDHVIISLLRTRK